MQNILAHDQRHIIITGAGGWLGMALLDELARGIGAAFAGRVHPFVRDARELQLRNGIKIKALALADIANLPHDKNYLCFHFACRGQELVDSHDYHSAHLALRATLLQGLEKLPLSGLLLASSGAARQPKNMYGELKLADEVFFKQFAAQKNCALIMPRIYNLSGAYINKLSHYALASLVLAALANEAQMIRARHPVIRSYVDVAELLRASLAWLLQAAPGACTSGDTLGERAVEIGALAAMIGAVLGQRATIRRDFQPTLPPDYYVGQGGWYAALCQAAGISPAPLAEQIKTTADYLRHHGST